MTSVQLRAAATEATINAAAYRQIRSDIVSCRWMPNERLRVEAMRDYYGLGGSPIREALMRLETESLVVLEQNKGFRVSPVSRDLLVDLTRTRVEIEGIALRWSIEAGGVEWEADLLGAFHRLSHQRKTAINAVWFEHHRNFHSALVAACNSPTLNAVREKLFAQAERYVALSIVSKFPARNDIAEHEQIMRTALSRNAAKAVLLHTAHIKRTADRVAKSLGENGELIDLKAAGSRIGRQRKANPKTMEQV